MSVVLTSSNVEMEFSGVGGGWTSVIADIRAAGYPLQCGYGIRGSGPTDRVASTGILTFALENSPANSGHKLGYYSPSNANLRAGFGVGIRVRFSLVFSGTTYYKFLGTIDSIAPAPGLKGVRVSLVTVVDWMDDAARYELLGLPTVLNTTADAVMTQILAAAPTQPNATSFDAGSDNYAFATAMQTSSSQTPSPTTALAEFQKIALSELGRIVIRGSTSAATAGQLRLFSRGAFVTSPQNVSQVTLNDSMFDLDPSAARKAVFNVFRMTVHPRSYDPTSAAPVVLYQATGTSPPIDPGQSLVINAQYIDPNQKAAQVNGYGMIVPVVGTDVRFNSNADGSGTDLSANFTISAPYGADGVKYTISNTGGVTGFVVGLQARGFGIYDYAQINIEVRDATSVTANGEIPVSMDLWYQQDPTFAQIAATYLLQFWKTATTLVTAVTFNPHLSSTVMTQALAREPGDKITIQETVSGISRDFHIQAIDLTLDAHNLLTCKWTLTPQADSTAYWILEAGGSALGTNTVVAL